MFHLTIGWKSKSRSERHELVASLSLLTPREREVLKLLAGGKSNKQALRSFGISPRTVETHRLHIMRKLGLASYSDLIHYAIRNGILEP